MLFGKVVAEAEMKDLEEMKAHNVGLKMMQVEAGEMQKPLTETFIRQLHKILLREDYTVYRNLPGGVQTSYTIHAGCYKTRPNSVITRYGDRFEYASPEETPSLMNDLIAWYNEAEQSGEYTPVQLAALFHYRYIRIHPFEDGNGRIARLLVNYILTKHDYPMIVVRSRLKSDYLEALHAADQIVGPTPSKGAHASLTAIRPFLQYFKSLVAREVYTDVCFLTEHDKNLWWYDGERIEFRTENYANLLMLMMTEPVLTLEEIQRRMGINMSAVKKLVNQLIDKHYIERGSSDGSWRVFITPSI